MKYFASWQNREFILCLGYKSHAIKDFFLNYEARTRDFTIQLGTQKSITYHTDHEESNWRITLAETGLQALTGARIKRIQKYVADADNFLLTYGDGVGDVDLDRLVDYHRSHGKILTVTGVRPPGRFGELVADAEGTVTEFNEKPQATGGRISGGYFVCRRELFDYLGEREDLVFEQGPMRSLVRDQQLAVYEHDGFWQCMDTYRDWQYLNGLCEKGGAPWIRW